MTQLLHMITTAVYGGYPLPVWREVGAWLNAYGVAMTAVTAWPVLRFAAWALANESRYPFTAWADCPDAIRSMITDYRATRRTLTGRPR
ncbi:MAG TPA: hypothetical protein VHE33_10055 [Acidobacteriaceae bacterium]|nr:hypothetical protein [Acidobacteriaceae bacterium]